MTPALKLAALGLLTLTMSACVSNPPRYQASVTYSSVPGGYYEPWGYYYYPDVQVYFHVSTGDYFYLSGRRWLRTRVLPTYIHLDSHDRVKLRIENERPYLHHRQHVERYRPRPHYRPTPQQDRREREENRRWYQEQQQFKSQRRYAPPAVQHRPSPVPRRDSREFAPQPRFEAPLLQPSPSRQVRPPQERRQESPPQRQEPRRIERGTIFLQPPADNQFRPGRSNEGQRKKSRQSSPADQDEEPAMQQRQDQKRSKKSRREQEQEQQQQIDQRR